MICFGPVPSRRLGKSLGINNIAGPKACTFSCQYCQIGITSKYTFARREFFKPEIIVREVKQHLHRIKANDKPDFLTFVSNGEPTLDINLGKSISLLKQFNIPIAVITNASLLVNPKVCENLYMADLVSVKVDTNNKNSWENINWPFYWFDFERHIDGILKFSQQYKGKLLTETMLVQGVNDAEIMVEETAAFIKQLNPAKAYISIPTRPPAIPSVKAPSETTVNEAFQIFSKKVIPVELLIGFEGTDTGNTGNAFEDIINICAVHPLREDSMQELLKKDNADINVLETLIHEKYIRRVQYKTENFYVRQYQV